MKDKLGDFNGHVYKLRTQEDKGEVLISYSRYLKSGHRTQSKGRGGTLTNRVQLEAAVDRCPGAVVTSHAASDVH